MIKYCARKSDKLPQNGHIGFSGSIIIKTNVRGLNSKPMILRLTKSISLSLPNNCCVSAIIKKSAKTSFHMEKGFLRVIIDEKTAKLGLVEQRAFFKKLFANRRFNFYNNQQIGKGNGFLNSKTLLFKNIQSVEGKEQNIWFSPASLYLASSLKKEGIPVVVSESKISYNGEILRKDELISILENNRDINFVCLSLCEDYIDSIKEIVHIIREHSNAFIAVGGVMPTLTPEHAFVYLPDVNFVVRGAGESILPELLKIINGADTKEELSEEQTKCILKRNGIIFYCKDTLVTSNLDKINEINNFDESDLDFSFLTKDDVLEGLNLFTSRGCYNNCYFCTTPGRGNFTAKSSKNIMDIVKKYYNRLKELFPNNIPNKCFQLSFNDDDFLADPERAIDFFLYLEESPFYINFIQTGINSFFLRQNRKRTNELNTKLINSIKPELFLPKKGVRENSIYLYIGTENFSDDELKRLGKGYTFKDVELVVSALSERRVYQAHHLILTNTSTTVEDLLENLLKITCLKGKYGEYFGILKPIITNLVSLYPSLSYKMLQKQNSMNIEFRILRINSFREFDYPIVKRDIPLDNAVYVVYEKLAYMLNKGSNYISLIDNFLLYLLLYAEYLSSENDKNSDSISKKLYDAVEKYKNYERITGNNTEISKGNIQVMITRNCQLRCRYCPVVKTDTDMNEKTILSAVDFLFSSPKKDLRLDFTGGEPLLKFNLIKTAVEYAKKSALKYGKNISFYMVTNCLGITEEIAEFLKKEKFQLELSLDGNETTHNENKIPVDNRINVYKRSVLNMKSLLQRGIDNFVIMVVTPQNTSQLHKNFSYITELGFNNIHVNYAFGVMWREKDMKEFFRQLIMIKRDFVDDFKCGKISLGNTSTRVEPAILNPEIMVDVNGSVHLLSEWIFENRINKESHSLGNVFENSLKDFVPTRFKSYYMLFKNYTSHNKEMRQIILNNIEMGRQLSKFLKEQFVFKNEKFR